MTAIYMDYCAAAILVAMASTDGFSFNVNILRAEQWHRMALRHIAEWGF